MDPLALLPYALAAAGGRVGPYETASLIAAGVTLLQRSAGVVRALTGRRAAIWLPIGPAWFVALGASDGRGALVVDPDTEQERLSADLRAAGVGVVFTTRALADRLPAEMPRVLLDDAPRQAVVITGSQQRELDLGSHFGLELAGDTNIPGSPEECLAFGTPPFHSHATVLSAAQDLLTRVPFTPVDRTLVMGPTTSVAAFGAAVAAPLLAGGTLVTPPVPSARSLTDAVNETQATMLVTHATHIPSLTAFLEAMRGDVHPLKHIVLHGTAPDEPAFARLAEWASRQQVGLTCV